MPGDDKKDMGDLTLFMRVFWCFLLGIPSFDFTIFTMDFDPPKNQKIIRNHDQTASGNQELAQAQESQHEEDEKNRVVAELAGCHTDTSSNGGNICAEIHQKKT